MFGSMRARTFFFHLEEGHPFDLWWQDESLAGAHSEGSGGATEGGGHEQAQAGSCGTEGRPDAAPNVNAIAVAIKRTEWAYAHGMKLHINEIREHVTPDTERVIKQEDGACGDGLHSHIEEVHEHIAQEGGACGDGPYSHIEETHDHVARDTVDSGRSEAECERNSVTIGDPGTSKRRRVVY